MNLTFLSCFDEFIFLDTFNFVLYAERTSLTLYNCGLYVMQFKLLIHITVYHYYVVGNTC